MKHHRLTSAAAGLGLALAAATSSYAPLVLAQPTGADAAEPEAAEPVDGAEPEDTRTWSQKAWLDIGPLALAPVVLVSLQASPYVGEDSFFQAGDIAEQAGFRLRRARFGLAGDYDGQARFAVTAQLSSDEGGSLRIKDAWAGFTRWDFLRAFVGAQAVPYSRSALTRSGNSALIERPLAVRAIAPFNQVGVALDGDFWDGALGYTAGLYNGFQRSEYFYGGWSENYAPFGNRFDGLAYAGRLRSEPLGKLDPTIADEHHSPFRLGVGANYFFSDGGARDVHSAGGDALMHVAGFHLLAEALWSLSDPESVPTQPTGEVEQVSTFAIVGETGYMILKDTLGIAARFEWIDPNTNTDDEGDNWLLTAGVGYQLLDRLLKVQADYTHREELSGLSMANDSVTLQFQLQLSALAAPGRGTDRDGEPDAEPETEAEATVEAPARGRAATETPEAAEAADEEPDEPTEAEPREEPAEDEGDEDEGEGDEDEDAAEEDTP